MSPNPSQNAFLFMACVGLFLFGCGPATRIKPPVPKPSPRPQRDLFENLQDFRASSRVDPPEAAACDGACQAIVRVAVIDVVAVISRPDCTDIIRGDRVAVVGPSARTQVPREATIIDGRGKFLIPGLWDMHAHLVDPALPELFLRYGV